jgi:hypothetical protein
LGQWLSSSLQGGTGYCENVVVPNTLASIIMTNNKNNNNLKTTSSCVTACACTTPPLSAKDADAFSNAIKKKWYYKWNIYDLPAWGMVGELLLSFQKHSSDSDAAITHLHAHAYTEHTIRSTVQHQHDHDHHENNNDKEAVAASAENIIAFNIARVDLVSSTESLIKVEAGSALVFTTKIEWEHFYYNSNPHDCGNANKRGNRADRYLDYSFL